jgi:nucleotide-binding universal stress UspA family protein
MKTILALVGGGARDEVICQTAFAVARPLSAHLEFLHIHVSPGEAARYNRAEFAMGSALRETLNELQSSAKSFSDLAAENVRAFCGRSAIELCDVPVGTQKVTATFREEKDKAIERLIFHARHNDLIVMGRAKQTQGLPPDMLERLILNSGRPMLIAASTPATDVTGTVLVCWKESGNSARAVAAATPILAKAKRVVFASIKERDDGVEEALHDLARQFSWNGVASEVKIIPADGRKVPDLLAAAAEACKADLVVMGAYGHSRARKLLFGSATEAFLGHADRPILLMH